MADLFCCYIITIKSGSILFLTFDQQFRVKLMDSCRLAPPGGTIHMTKCNQVLNQK